MGTSSSSKGPRSSAPLVPDHADASPDAPLPQPQGQRFRGFRTQFGRAAAGGGTDALHSAIGHYARKASGGSLVGPRRFGPAYVAGAGLAGALRDMQSGGTGEAATGVDLSGLIGQPLDVAGQQIARVLAPENADADQITAAIQEAMAEALPGMDIFDPTALSADQLVQLLVEFFSRVVFQEITNTAGDAWNKSPDADRTVQLEAELLELVRVTVDKHLSPRLSDGLEGLSRAKLSALERAAVTDVWRDWERYE